MKVNIRDDGKIYAKIYGNGYSVLTLEQAESFRDMLDSAIRKLEPEITHKYLLSKGFELYHQDDWCSDYILHSADDNYVFDVQIAVNGITVSINDWENVHINTIRQLEDVWYALNGHKIPFC